jgi:hypothetical protein
MAVYKVIQDIEAEDKLLGPLTLKGFVYAVIALACAFIDFRLMFVSALGPVRWVIMLVFLGPMILFGTLASPLGREQPTEIWLLSRLRFLLKSRRRIWDQNGIKQLVTITAPKREDKRLTKDMSQTEVQSRLQALATTLDSRGWSVKNITVNLNNQPNYFDSPDQDSDRLVQSSTIEEEQPVVDIHAEDDILDEENNPTAQNFQSMMQQAEQDRKAQMANRLEAARHAAQVPHAPVAAVPARAPAHPDQLTDDEQQLLQKIHQQDAHLASQHIIKGSEGLDTELTLGRQTAKLELAHSGNDLSVASIASLASRGSQPGLGDDTLYLH